MRNFFQAEASNRTERPDLCLAETMKRRSDTMKRTMKRALFPLMLALVLLLPACGSGGGNGAPADQTASSTPGAAGGETAEFGGI